MAQPLTDAVLVLPAGGRGERLAALPEARGINKAALAAHGTSLIARTASLYVRSGVRTVIALVGHRAESVRRALRRADLRGAEIRIVADPPSPVGKGGAIRRALDSGAIPAGRPFIVHNPDDQIVGMDRTFAARIWRAHARLARHGALATAVCVPETEYAYTAFTAGRRGLAASAVMYPRVRMPTHVGVTVFSPAAAGRFRRAIPPGRRCDFESVVLPRLARARRLGLCLLPAGAWIPVNDLKGFRALLAAL